MAVIKLHPLSCLFLSLLLPLTACHNTADTKRLPYLGHYDLVDGEKVYPSIRDFEFMDQDSTLVNKETFKDKIYVADFFFINCPTICPKVKAQMKRVYDHFEKEDRILFLSHSIDTKYDTIPALKKYQVKLGVEAHKWKFVTGQKDSLYAIASDYFSVAKEDEDAPGGFDHSGRLLLIDQGFHVRSFCDGTDPSSVDVFIKDIEILLNER
jgi:protein SCO1